MRRECDPPAGRLMSRARHAECQSKPHYFQMFLGETKKPCQRIKRQSGLGDMVAWILKRLGVKKKPGCKCDERQAWLNRIGERLAGWFGWKK